MNYTIIASSLALGMALWMSSSIAVTVSSPIYEPLWSTQEWPRIGFVLTSITGNQNGNVYVAGRNDGSGGFVAAYSTEGDLNWQRQVYAGAGLDHIRGIDIDVAGNVFVAGETYRMAEGAFVAKFSPSGQRLWVRNVGSTGIDSGSDVAIDRQGNAYLVGSTTGKIGEVHHGGYDIFLTKITPQGGVVWTRQYDDTIGVFSKAMAIDPSDNLILAGQTAGVTGATLSKFDSGGQLLWKVAPNYATVAGRSSSYNELVVDPYGNIYTVGFTNVRVGIDSAIEQSDAFLAKHDNDGHLLWHRLLPGSPANEALGLALRSDGTIYISGMTDVTDSGEYTNQADGFVAGFSSAGEQLWYREFGTEYSDYPLGVYIDERDRMFVAGFHWDYIPPYDDSGFLVRFDPIPEPRAGVLVALLFPLAILSRALCYGA